MWRVIPKMSTTEALLSSTLAPLALAMIALLSCFTLIVIVNAQKYNSTVGSSGVEGIWGKLVIGSNRCDNRGQ